MLCKQDKGAALKGKSILEVVQSATEAPVRNNGGGHYNHSYVIFFLSLDLFFRIAKSYTNDNWSVYNKCDTQALLDVHDCPGHDQHGPTRRSEDPH